MSFTDVFYERTNQRAYKASIYIRRHPEILDIIYKRKIHAHVGECTEMHAHSHFNGKTSQLALHSGHISIPLKHHTEVHTKFCPLPI